MRLRRFLRDMSGATAVEAALISVPMVALTFGIIEVGRALYMQQALSFATDKAARLLYINPKASQGQMLATVTDSVFFIDPKRLQVALTSVQQPVGSEDFATLRLTVSYDFVSLVPKILTGTISLSSDRHIVVVKDPIP